MKITLERLGIGIVALALLSCQGQPLAPKADSPTTAKPMVDDSCWGQATKAFALLGKLGEHASEQPVPRYGLRNLARELYEMGEIDDDSLEALGRYVSDLYGLSIDACIE